MIELKNVSKKFIQKNQEIVALENVSLKIQKGEVVVLKGRSGSGKSTLLSLIAGLSKPTTGEIIVDAERISRLSDDFAAAFRLRHIGFIFQRYNLFEQMSVFENLLAPLIPLDLSVKELKERIERITKLLHVEEKTDAKVRVLSGGEQQRVAIARSLINDPSLILADEPTANLDATLSKEFVSLLEGLKNRQRTMLIATHDPIFFDLDFVDRIIEIDGGRLCL